MTPYFLAKNPNQLFKPFDCVNKPKMGVAANVKSHFQPKKLYRSFLIRMLKLTPIKDFEEFSRISQIWSGLPDITPQLLAVTQEF